MYQFLLLLLVFVLPRGLLGLLLVLVFLISLFGLLILFVFCLLHGCGSVNCWLANGNVHKPGEHLLRYRKSVLVSRYRLYWRRVVVVLCEYFRPRKTGTRYARSHGQKPEKLRYFAIS